MAAQTLVERARRLSLGALPGDTNALVASLAHALADANEPAHATQIARTLFDIAETSSIEPAAGALLAAAREGRGDAPTVLRALGATGSPDALVPLLERVISDEVRVRMAVLDALGRYFDRAPPDGRAADPLLAVLGQVTAPEREPTIALLGRVGAARALPTLRTLLAHEDASIRLAAIRAIGAIGDPEGAPAVLPLLDDDDGRLRYEAARAVGRSAPAELVSGLLDRARSDEPVDRHAILLALALALPRLTLSEDVTARAIETLIAFAQGDDEGLASRALNALGAWHPPAASAPLAALREGPTRSPAVLRALGSYDDDRARAALREALAEGTVAERAQAASVLGEHGTREDAAMLLERAASLPWPASASAAFAIARLARRGQLELAQAHTPLCGLARSHDPFVRANVAIAMAALAAPPCQDGVSPLVWLERGHAGVVRAAAARWARAASEAGHLPAASVDQALAACAGEPLTPELGEVCARPTLAALDASADVYAYAPDGEQLWGNRLIALRLADGSVWVTYSDANGHLRLSNAPRGDLALEDPSATPLEP
jgi:HEAT repeat protein